MNLQELQSSSVRLRCAPELGGRVFSLVSRQSGREWLWRRTDGPDLFRPSDPLDFGTGTFAGLDECVPTVGACSWPDGRRLPDHGSLWAREWSVHRQRPDCLDLRVEDPALGFRFRRRIALHGATVAFSYRLENPGSVAGPALWSMHPLFALRDGDRLELPPGIEALRVEGADAALARGGRIRDGVMPYPEIAPGVRLDEFALPDVERGYLKAFAGPLAPADAWAALTNSRTGDRLEVTWDANAAPYLGLWLTRGGYRGWHHVAIEPTNAPCDRADDAATDPRLATAVTLGPNETRSWWVEWTLS